MPQDLCAYRRSRAAGEVGVCLLQSLKYAARANERITWLSTDFEGAFENVSRTYLKDLLRLLGVGEAYIGMLGHLWDGMKGLVNYGGVEQEAMDMSGGLTQGAPESALLFNVALIPLQAVLSGIKGYCMGKGLKGAEGYEEEMEKRNIVTYSDDSNICCRMERGSVGRVLRIVEGFCQVSGQIVNVGKTKVFLSHDPSQEEIEMLESLGLSKEKFILPKQRIKIVGV